MNFDFLWFSAPPFHFGFSQCFIFQNPMFLLCVIFVDLNFQIDFYFIFHLHLNPQSFLTNEIGFLILSISSRRLEVSKVELLLQVGTFCVAVGALVAGLSFHHHEKYKKPKPLID